MQAQQQRISDVNSKWIYGLTGWSSKRCTGLGDGHAAKRGPFAGVACQRGDQNLQFVVGDPIEG